MPNALKAFLMSLGSGQLDLTAPYYRAMDAALRRRALEQRQKQFDASLPIRQSQAEAAMMGARTSAGRLGFDVKKYTEEPARRDEAQKKKLDLEVARDLDPQGIAEMRGDVGPPPSVGKLQTDVAKRKLEEERRKAFAREGAKTYGAGERAKLRLNPQAEMRRRMYERMYYDLQKKLGPELDKVVAAGRAKGEEWPDPAEIRKGSNAMLESLRQAAETGEFVPVGGGAAPQGQAPMQQAPAAPPQPAAPASPFTPAAKPTISRQQAKEIMDQLLSSGQAKNYDEAIAKVGAAYNVMKE